MPGHYKARETLIQNITNAITPSFANKKRLFDTMVHSNSNKRFPGQQTACLCLPPSFMPCMPQQMMMPRQNSPQTVPALELGGREAQHNPSASVPATRVRQTPVTLCLILLNCANLSRSSASTRNMKMSPPNQMLGLPFPSFPVSS